MDRIKKNKLNKLKYIRLILKIQRIWINKIKMYKLIYKDHLLQNNPINMQFKVKNQKKIRIYQKLKMFK